MRLGKDYCAEIGKRLPHPIQTQSFLGCVKYGLQPPPSPEAYRGLPCGLAIFRLVTWPRNNWQALLIASQSEVDQWVRGQSDLSWMRSF